MKIKKKDKDFILKGNTTKVLLTLSTPLILSNLISMLYDLADGLWLAQLSAIDFTATGFTFPIIFLFISMSLGLSIGGISLISQKIGASKFEKASNYARHLLLISLVIGLFFSIIGYFLSPIIVRVMGAKGALYVSSTKYLTIISTGFIIDAMIFCFQAILNSQGKTVQTTIMGFTSGILNIILDPFFIFKIIPLLGLGGLNLGIEGAALATIISKLISLIIGIIFIKNKKNQINVSFRGFKYSGNIVKRIFNKAIPTAIARAVTAFGFTICNIIIIMNLGQEVVTAFSLINRITSTFMQVSMGIGSAMTAIVGQHVGAKLIDRAKTIINKAFIFSIIASLIGVVLMYFYQDNIIEIFLKKKDGITTIVYAKEYANYMFINISAMGGFFIYMSIFQGIGRMSVSLKMALIRLWMIRIPLLLTFIHFTSFAQNGVWLAMSISNTIVLIYAHYKYKTDKLLFNRKL